MLNKIKYFFKVNKEGMIIGGIVGAIAYFIWKGFIPKQMSILSDTLLQAKGIVDNFVSLDIKLLLFFILLGITIGAIFDVVYNPKK